LITCFWWLCPELFTYGHIAKAVPPLFRITTKKNEYIYLRDAKALADYKDAHLNEKYQVNRLKGLGEQDPDELSDCLLNPKTRNAELLYVSDFENTDAFLEIIMGPDVPPRREYLLKYGEGANV
jgi:DNA gyrase subunit B